MSCRDMFQSHLGSILPAIRLGKGADSDTVSIPPWFDFARIQLLGGGTVECVSIPPWFDFARLRGGGRGAGVWFQSHLGSILPRLGSG